MYPLFTVSCLEQALACSAPIHILKSASWVASGLKNANIQPLWNSVAMTGKLQYQMTPFNKRRGKLAGFSCSSDQMSLDRIKEEDEYGYHRKDQWHSLRSSQIQWLCTLGWPSLSSRPQSHI